MKKNIKVIEHAKKDSLKVSEMQRIKGGGICLCNHNFFCKKYEPPRPPD